MARALRTLAAKKKATKFLKIKATECIQNFPDGALPCLLIYRGGKMQQKFETLRVFGGKKMKESDVEWHLSQVGACETELEENPRLEHLIEDVMEQAVSRNYDD